MQNTNHSAPTRPSPSSPHRFEGPDLRHTGGCTCKKSKCLKLYCQCFSSSTTCGARCRCQMCHNTVSHSVSIENARRVILDRNPAAFQDKFGTTLTWQPQYTYQPPRTLAPQQPTTVWQGPPPPALEQQPVGSNMFPPSGPPTLMAPSPPSAWSSYPSNTASQEVMSQHPRHSPSIKTTQTMASSPRSATETTTTSPARVNMNGCKCRKSFCLKKYCECYNHGARCGDRCRCQNCRNQPEGSLPPRPPPHAAFISIRDDDRATSPQIRLVHEERQPVSPQEPNAKGCQTEGTGDRMAMMAAVAMTQLLGGGAGESRVTPSEDGRNSRDTTKSPTFSSPGHKRKVSDGQDRSSPSLSMPLSKKKKAPSPTASIDDEEVVRAVIPTTLSVSPQVCREVSPVSKMIPLHQQHPYPPRCNEQPRALDGYAHQQPPYPPSSSNASSPCTVNRSSPYNTYEEATRNSGLPKSLSFRKICSQCGKTRGEHGELGFGNKCVFTDCGRCGAGEQVHRTWNVPMGIWCTLTEKEGALPGATEAYRRKIQDLAARAELQRGLQQQQNQRESVKLSLKKAISLRE